jgi:hypothetical protein
MHTYGVNLRHLGRVREKVKSPWSRKLLLSMALSRAFKSQLRKRMRRTVQEQEHIGLSSEVLNPLIRL